jgi:uncharacterized damage-inducible protein DinB
MHPENGPFFESQIALWRNGIKPTLNQALEITPEEKLAWSPAPGMINLGNIFLHIAECSDWWYDEIMKQRKSLELSSAPNAPLPAKSQIQAYMTIHWERLERMFAEPPDVFKKSYKVIGRTQEHVFDGYWVFTHLLEHDIHHRGQINQYLRILGITPPEI